MIRLFTFLILTLCLCSCQRRQPESDSVGTPIALQYANGFSIKKFKSGTLVEVLAPYQGATSGLKYFLLEKGEDAPKGMEDVPIIQIPIENIICTSTTHIPMLDYIGETNKLIGFPTLDYICSEKMRKRIDNGLVKELGVDKGMNLELIASLHASLVMGYTMTGDFGQFKKIEELGTPVVMNAEYLEKHPLGRAEWIKFVALFFKKEVLADSVFQVIEKEYLQTQALALQASTSPTIMSGIVYGDAWFLPGGQNYAARLLKDA
jgi:iron complex transport system substrate-binding protein